MKLPKLRALVQIERRLKILRTAAPHSRITTGKWLSYIRSCLGVSLNTLASRAKLSTATVQQIEARERTGSVTIATMQKLASAMECEFIYAIVPKDELTVFLKNKAQAKASLLLEEANVHMALEAQEVNTDLNERIDLLAEELLLKGDIW
jgi:predicted DNA-binding mobile mystery protein A